MCECRFFSIFTNQKPLINAFKQQPDTRVPCQLRQLDFISEFSINNCHTDCKEKVIADPFTRIEIEIISKVILDFKPLSIAQLM